jgi:hypothetical protein
VTLSVNFVVKLIVFLVIEKRQFVRNGTLIDRWRTVCVYCCDACGITYERRGGYETTQRSANGFTYCSSKCYGLGSRKGTEHNDSIRAKCLLNRGVEHPWQDPVVIAKREQTWIEKYGVTVPSMNNDVMDKVSETRKNRSEDEKKQTTQRTKETLQARYGEGVTNPMHIPGVADKVAVSNRVAATEADVKRRRTNLSRLGVEFPMQSEDVRAKSVMTCVGRYGGASSMSSPEVRAKAEITNMQRLGVRNPMQDPRTFSRAQRSRKRSQIIKHWRTGEDLVCTASYEIAVVGWMNKNAYDFEWQVPFTMPDGHRYFIDMHVLSGPFVDTWVEIKGYYDERAKKQCTWFRSEHTNFQLWDEGRLKELGIMRNKVRTQCDSSRVEESRVIS